MIEGGRTQKRPIIRPEKGKVQHVASKGARGEEVSWQGKVQDGQIRGGGQRGFEID